MKITKQLSPDAPPSEGTGGMNTVHHKANIPSGDVDFLAVAKTVLDSWAANTMITLVWTNQAEFAEKVVSYESTLTNRLTTGANRPIETQTMNNLDTEIDNAVEEVKIYISEKYGRKNAQAHYNQFGIEHHGYSWSLSADRQERKQKLMMMVAAIASNGFGTKPFGTAFWTAKSAAYDIALTNATSIDQQVSGDVGEKNMLKISLKNTMIALRYVLRGNYPDTYPEVYRQWGWIKD